jgi:hypothetical protein
MFFFIILMYFQAKSILKSNWYYTLRSHFIKDLIDNSVYQEERMFTNR